MSNAIIPVLLITFLVLLVLKVPVSISIMSASIVALLTCSSIDVVAVIQRMYVSCESFSLLAVPFFIMAGGFMEGGGISRRIVNFASSLIGHIKGGLAMTSVLASMIFAGISGSAAADTAAIGSILIPAMDEDGYGKDMATSVVATGGAIGIVIPPSIPMVLIGVACNISIGKLFLGGILPGILIGLSLMIISYVYAKKRNLKTYTRSSIRQILHATKEAFWALLTIVIILGGIMSGFFTATEAAAIASVYTLLVGLFIYKELNIKRVAEIMYESAITTGVVVLCIATASAFGWILSAEDVPTAIANAIVSLSDNKIVIMLLINAVFLCLGMIMDIAPIILVVVPIMYPIAMSLGLSPVHFGIMAVVNMAIGQCTPPVGVALYVAMGISKEKIANIYKTYYAYLAAMILVLVLVTFVPALSEFLPSVLF